MTVYAPVSWDFVSISHAMDPHAPKATSLTLVHRMEPPIGTSASLPTTISIPAFMIQHAGKYGTASK